MVLQSGDDFLRSEQNIKMAVITALMDMTYLARDNPGKITRPPTRRHRQELLLQGGHVGQ